MSYSGSDLNQKVRYRLVSTNYNTGGETAIIVNDVNYSKMKDGVNIVIFDKVTNKLVDSVNYNGELRR